MIYEQETVRTLYRKLLSLYPRRFREQLGESMEQTFNDLCTEKRQTKQGLFGFVLSAFGETIAGIVQEYILLFTQGDPMKNTFTNFRSPALISLLLVIPFMIMEVVNRREFNEGFPIPLFIMMWVLSLILILIATPIIQNMRAGNNITAHPVNLLLRVIVLSLVAWFWASLLIDQMPCFLGVPNCD
jgi:hypothetical protein